MALLTHETPDLARQKHIALSRSEADYYPDSSGYSIADNQPQKEGAHLPVGFVLSPYRTIIETSSEAMSAWSLHSLSS